MRALPWISTVSPPTVSRSSPGLPEFWKAARVFLFSRSLQYRARTVWTEPVTGSSFTPAQGLKYLDSKSYTVDAFVTAIPLLQSPLYSAILVKFGEIAARSVPSPVTRTTFFVLNPQIQSVR